MGAVQDVGFWEKLTKEKGNMFGKLLKVATLPLDAINIVADIVTTGDGSKSSRKEVPLLGDIERARDAIAEDLDSY